MKKGISFTLIVVIAWGLIGFPRTGTAQMSADKVVEKWTTGMTGTR